MGNINQVLLKYYSKYYSGDIEVFDYETEVLEIEKKDMDRITVRFGVTPQVGAHNPLGYDEITYTVDVFGNKELVTYQHIKDYEIPEQFQQYIIKPGE